MVLTFSTGLRYIPAAHTPSNEIGLLMHRHLLDASAIWLSIHV